ncbi:MAG: thioredoxin-disulfide reductase [Sphingomonadales bacterium 32-68-7]|nr:MAG: thioredoxin-disulfide reductase [Sphingomonadales bacterium 12-68-11]OYX08017.1 MAG: thioredoxin-disulfide reductase [Sphingomonadales bacterium 32-68-7]
MESIGDDLKFMTPRPFKPEHFDTLAALGQERRYAAGEMIVEVGDRWRSFHIVMAGEVEVPDPFTGERWDDAKMGPGQFLGEMSFLSGGAATFGLRAAIDTVLLEIPRTAMLEFMARMPEVGDHVLTVLAARRRMLFEQGASALTLVGAERDPAVQRVASFLSRNRIPFQSFELDSDDAAAEAIYRLAQHRPSVITDKGTRLEDPTPRKVATILGLDLDIDDIDDLDLVIVGGGPAGVAAAVYAGSEGLCALVVEDTAIGGQAGTSSRIENFMGFPTGISGADLTYRGQIQAMKFGTRFAMPRQVRGLAQRGEGFCVTLDDGTELCARNVLVATGVQYRRLPIERLEAFEGSGVFYAATDMEARFCRETEAVVIGGGNSAGQAAMYLSRAARHVHLLVRRSDLISTMSAYLRERLEANPRITIHYQAQLTAVDGDDHLRAVEIETPAGRQWIAASALFVMIGAAPNTAWLSGLVELDDKGFVRTGPEVGAPSAYQTSLPGIFAVGDVRAGSTKRVASAVGEGSVVVSAIWTRVDDLRRRERA